MFTGLIEDIGIVADIKRKSNTAELHVKANIDLSQSKYGDSISVNGVCLTMIYNSAHEFKADISQETFQKTSLRQLHKGDIVNLERPLKLSDPLGGHLVLGHVDETAKIDTISASEGFHIVTFTASHNVISYLIQKGSIAIDGISLTIMAADDNTFSISVIPHTWFNTNLKNKKTGDFVNIEIDVIGKYIERFLKRGESKITYEFLSEHGFA